jgi:hypothetical protein
VNDNPAGQSEWQQYPAGFPVHAVVVNADGDRVQAGRRRRAE